MERSEEPSNDITDFVLFNNLTNEPSGDGRVGFSYLFIAGVLSFMAAIAHVFIIAGGPKWYRFFGAGEQMAVMAEEKSLKPALITGAIAMVLGVWALYAWSGAGIIPKLPLLKVGLVVITGIYLLRGLIGLVAPLLSDHPAITANSKPFWFWSSLICSAYGAIHLMGLISVWDHV